MTEPTISISVSLIAMSLSSFSISLVIQVMAWSCAKSGLISVIRIPVCVVLRKTFVACREFLRP